MPKYEDIPSHENLHTEKEHPPYAGAKEAAKIIIRNNQMHNGNRTRISRFYTKFFAFSRR